nr:hypothetical protein [Tanacetum cinerariifolium]
TNIADLSKHTTRYISPILTQKVFANMRRVRKGFSGVETPLFESMLAVRDVAEDAEAQVPAQGDDVHEHAAEEVATDVVPPTPTSPSPSSPVIPSPPPHQSPWLENANAAQQLEIVKLKARVKKLEKLNQGRNIVDMDQDEGIELVVDQEKDAEVLSMQEDDTEVQEAVEVVTTAKLITEVVIAAATQVVAASTPVPAAKPKILKIAVAPARYHGIKKKPQTESEARKNMISYLKNTEGYKMDFFKGKTYDEILPILQARFDANIKFLFKSREEME